MHAVAVGDRFRFDGGNRDGEIHTVTWMGRRWMTCRVEGGPRAAERKPGMLWSSEKTEIIFGESWKRESGQSQGRTTVVTYLGQEL